MFCVKKVIESKKSHLYNKNSSVYIIKSYFPLKCVIKKVLSKKRAMEEHT